MGWYEARLTERPGAIRCVCTECKGPFWLPPSKVGEFVACSPACSKARSARLKESRRRECATCGTLFYPRWTQINAGNGKFCSQRCNVAGRTAMNAPEAQTRARLNWKARFIQKPFMPTGERNYRWNGGPQARYERWKASGGVREQNVRRRSRFNLAGPIELGITRKLGELQRWKCAVCRASLKAGYDLDHIMPLARGGTNESSNLQLLCVPCNRRKHTKHPVDFMRSRGFLL